jgi:hypothetical protein
MAFPTTLSEFVAASAFAMLFWSAFFIGAIIEGE